jgi:hypothetical protein
MAALLDKPELVAVAALLRQLRDGSALPVRQPSFNAPTFLSKPLTITQTAAVPVSATWTDFLQYSAPVQFIGVISSYVASSLEPISAPGIEFRVAVNEAVKFSLAPGVDPCRLASSPWPRRPRKVRIFVNEQMTAKIQCRNLGAVPRTAILAFFGWAYDTINIYPEGEARLGMTDV